MTDQGITFTWGPANVHYLTAPHEALVKAFGDDGTVSPRDDYKSEAEWDVPTPHGVVEVYDYKVGKAYNGPDGLDRTQITNWHVQGDREAILAMLDKLGTVEIL